MQVRFSRKFSKQRDKAPKKIQQAFNKRLTLFLTDPFSPLLKNHMLGGTLVYHRSINISGDWRALYREETDEQSEDVVEPISKPN